MTILKTFSSFNRAIILGTVIALAAPMTVMVAHAQTVTSEGVNGRNIDVAYFDGGRFEKTSPGVWKEYGLTGGPRFTFRETMRDDWSVYLRDDGRNGDIQIDVHRKWITMGWNGAPRQDQYKITRVGRTNSSPAPTPDRGGSSSSGSTTPRPVPSPTTRNTKATLYQHCNYEGYAVELPSGSYDLYTLLSKGMKNDDISSIKVAPGYKVEVFQDARYLGNRRTLQGNTSCLTTYGMNDKLSSIKVMSQNAPSTPRPVTQPATRPVPAPRPVTATKTKADQCMDMVQGKVAYNQAGTKTWDSNNLRKLCNNTKNPQHTVSCFKNGIQTHNDWSRAIKDCNNNQSFSSASPATQTAPRQRDEMDWTPAGVTGFNVGSAWYDNGFFAIKEEGSKIWEETPNSGPNRWKVSHTFQEIRRTRDTVLLKDSKRNIDIEINVPRKMIRIKDSAAPMRDLYKVKTLTRPR